MSKALEQTILLLRREKMIMRDTILSAINELGSGHPVTRRLGAALRPGTPKSIPCALCNRVLKSKASIQRGMGAFCYKKHLADAQKPLPFRKQ